jgi:hypothetical protein
VAEVDALVSAGTLVLCVLCALVYDLATWPEGLLAVFVLASLPLVLVAGLDVLSWRRMTAAQGPVNELRSLAVAGLALLAFGGVFTAIEVGVGGLRDSDLAAWTSTAVGYLLAAALVAQSLLTLLTWQLRRRPW